MIAEAEKYAEEDKKVKESLEARRQLETYISQMSQSLGKKGSLHDKLEKSDIKEIKEAIKDVKDWLDSNEMAEGSDYEDKLRDL
jgi:heat shock protein 5